MPYLRYSILVVAAIAYGEQDCSAFDGGAPPNFQLILTHADNAMGYPSYLEHIRERLEDSFRRYFSESEKREPRHPTEAEIANIVTRVMEQAIPPSLIAQLDRKDFDAHLQVIELKQEVRRLTEAIKQLEDETIKIQKESLQKIARHQSEIETLKRAVATGYKNHQTEIKALETAKRAAIQESEKYRERNKNLALQVSRFQDDIKTKILADSTLWKEATKTVKR